MNGQGKITSSERAHIRPARCSPRGKKIRIPLKMMIVCVSILAMVSIGSANGLVGGLTRSNNIIPMLFGENLTCSDIAACTNHEGNKIEQPDSGDYSGTYYFDSTEEEVLTIESLIIQNQKEQNSINGSSNVDVSCVIMKGANGADFYGYTPPARSDTFFPRQSTPRENLRQ